MAQMTCTCGERISNVGTGAETGEIVRGADLARLYSLPEQLEPFRSIDSDAERRRWVQELLGLDEEFLRTQGPSTTKLADLIANELLSPWDAPSPEAFLCGACGRLWLESDAEPLHMREFKPVDESVRLRFPAWPSGLELRLLDPVPESQVLAELRCSCGCTRTLTGEAPKGLEWLRPADTRFHAETYLKELLSLWLCGAAPDRAPLVGCDADALAPGELLVGMALALALRLARIAWHCEGCERLWVQRYAGARGFQGFVRDPDASPGPT